MNMNDLQAAFRAPAATQPSESEGESFQELLARFRDYEFEAMGLRQELAETPAGQALAALEAQMESLKQTLKEVMTGIEGVQKTSEGQVGYQVRKTVTYRPETVRRLAPDAAPLCIVESVDKTKLESLKKGGFIDPFTMERIEAEADVKPSTAFILKVA